VFGAGAERGLAAEAARGADWTSVRRVPDSSYRPQPSRIAANAR